MMNSATIKSLLLALITTAFMGTAQAQEERAYARVFYVDVKPGKGAEYREFNSEVWSKVNQVRADAGEISAYYLNRARVPSGERANCDYMAVYVPQGGLGGESMSMDDALKKAKIKMTGDEFWEKVRDLSSLLYSEIWYRVDKVGPDAEVRNLMMLDYMDVHNVDDWLEMEDTIFNPVHEARIKDGAMVGWSAHRLFLPRGTSVPYNAATVNIFPDWASIGNMQVVNYFEKTHSNLDTTGLWKRVGASRDIVRSDVFEIIGKVTPSK